MRCLGTTSIVVALAASAQGQSSVTLAWDPSPGSAIAGYRLYEGAASRTYTNVIAAGKVTSNTVSSLVGGATYFFAVTAYDTNGLESDFSSEISYTVPVPSNSPPTIALTSPANNAAFTTPASISLSASVIANGHTITAVRFYNGSTLLGQVSAAPYSYIWGCATAGGYSLTAQVVYDTGSTATSAPANVTCVNATSVATIWPTTAVPGTVDGGSDSAVELGVKFRSDVAGSITGIRFYKATANTGTHLGHLWSSTGTMLASATFAGESASGWQQVNFATPVAIAANTVYVASYYATVGHYSADVSYFTSKGIDSPPLRALTNSVSGGNGVYAYGASSAFPNQTWSAANYWVDVVFQTGVAPMLTSMAVTPSNPSLLAGATQQFTATATYSDGSTQNVTSQATWTSSSTAVATINASGLATAVAAGSTTISAALAGVTGSTTLTVKTAPTLASIAMTPSNPSLLAGATQQFTATGTYSDGSTQNVTSQATWTSSSTTVATISASGLATAVAAGSTTIRAALAGVTGSTTLTVNAAPTLPAPWQTVDIGNVGLAGSAYLSGSLWSVSGAGTLSGTADAFRFLYQPMSADGEIRAQLSAVPNTSTNARVGVMIRETLTPGSRYAFIGISPGGTFRAQRRTSTSSSTASTVSSACAPPNVWVRLVRTGKTLYSYRSTDGTNWTLVSSNKITMATNIYFGLAVASGNTNTLNTSTFTNVTVVP